MYLCLCHGITEREVCAAIEQGVRTLDDLRAELGVATSCGRCACAAEELIEGRCAERPRRHAILEPA